MTRKSPRSKEVIWLARSLMVITVRGYYSKEGTFERNERGYWFRENASRELKEFLGHTNQEAYSRLLEMQQRAQDKNIPAAEKISFKSETTLSNRSCFSSSVSIFKSGTQDHKGTRIA